MRHRRIARPATLALLNSAAVAALFATPGHAITFLEFNTRGTPANPVIGPDPSFWNTTTGAFWSNGTADIPWVNGDGAEFNFTNALANANIQINDPSNSVSVAGIEMVNSNPNFSVGISGKTSADTLTLTDPTISVVTSGQVNIGVPIAGTVGMNLTSAGGSNPVVALTAPNTYTGPTSINAGELRLEPAEAGETTSFGNTSISISPNTQLTIGTQSFAGTTGAGTQGASLNIAGRFTFEPLCQNFTVNQEDGYTGTGLSFNNALLLNVFVQAPLSAFNTELIDNGPGTASVTGTNTIFLGLGNSVPSGSYTLISDPAGGLTGTFVLPNGLTSETIPANPGSHDGYQVQLLNSSTAEQVSIINTGGGVPEPATLGLAVCGSVLALARRRTRR
jgi:autotransporter-associated beta strand protein